MCPRPSDPSVRAALLEAAARLLVEEGLGALTTRRLADEVGVSTIAVYTYFEGMADLRTELAREGFAELSRALRAVARTDDPVADIARMGGAYVSYGIANPVLYRFTFHEKPDDPAVGSDAFAQLVDAVERAVDAGRFDCDPLSAAVELWVTTHGITSLCLAQLLSAEHALRTLASMGGRLFMGFGDTLESARGSIEAAASMEGRRSA